MIGLLPAATAVAVVLRTRERPSPSFWVFALLGAAAALVFATLQNGTPGALRPADLQLFGAVIAAAVGYAEGGLLARELGAWQTISWALVLAAPVMLAVAIAAGSPHRPSPPPPPGSRSATWPRSACSSDSSPGTAASRWAPWHR